MSSLPPSNLRCRHGCQWSRDFLTKYQIGKSIGAGSYGCIHEGIDKNTMQSVAIKKIRCFSSDPTEVKHLLREISILRMVKGHPGLISLEYLATSSPTERLEEIDLVFKRYDTDLHQIIRSLQPLKNEHLQYFIYQVICGVYSLHSAGLIHRDLKPSNLLIKSNCDLKICDFGLARAFKKIDTSFELPSPPQLFRQQTAYIVTRWYRSPEVILNYGAEQASDMWSVGCILAELVLRRPLFTADDYLGMLKVIFQLIGTPSAEDCNHLRYEGSKNYVKNLPAIKPQSFSDVFKNAEPNLIDLLEKLLVFNPAKRLTAEQALAHPFLQEFFLKEDVLKFPFKEKTPEDEQSLASYYQFEKELDDGSEKSNEEIIEWGCKLIQEEIKRYQPAAPNVSSAMTLSSSINGFFHTDEKQPQETQPTPFHTKSPDDKSVPIVP